MKPSVSAVRLYFTKLGLDNDIADLYLALYGGGPQNISALSRNSGVERTRIYRLIDTLLESSLIEVVPQELGRGGVIQAAPIANLRILINKREQELKNLTDELELVEQVMAQNSLSHSNTRIQLFLGIEGIRQMLVNELRKAKGTISGYGLLNSFETILGSEFIQYYSQTLKTNHVAQQFSPVSPSGEIKCYAWHSYQGIAAYYRLDKDDVYGLEIHDRIIAKAQLASLTI